MWQNATHESKRTNSDLPKSVWKKPYQLADEANVSRTSVYRFLNGERDLLLDTANKLKDQMELLYPEQSTVESGKQPVN